ncbi:MAG: alpha-L-arabinofuranosidase C-terminal domain-containing protein [Clostridiaceae bacterium]|nr:alpha-L-arabinofuranosidase C-terminal domain-containing protein [Clostridiaceae bacterium]
MKKICLMYPDVIGVIKPEIYGHFTEHIGGVFYDGLWVGKDSPIANIHGFRKELINRFNKINPPVVRWPGGCYSETYDWRDGIGENRPRRINWWTAYDNRYETNEVGTHEFAEFCSLVGAKPYFAVNLSSLPPLEARKWMDYCLSPQGTTSLACEREKNGHAEPFSIPYWGVGNENWGGGGNMAPDIYAHEYRKYSELMSNVASEAKLFACGPNGDDYNWTQKFMEVFSASEKHMAGYSMHYYCGSAGDPVRFTRKEWYEMLRRSARIEEILLRHWHIIQGYGMEQYGRLVIDEWGCWHPNGSGPSKGRNLFEQQSTMRDAMVTAQTLNVFNNHCDKIQMANVAQLVNNLHCLFLTSGDHCIVTPTYHVFDMYQVHQNAAAVRTLTYGDQQIEGINTLSVSASVKEGFTFISIANLSAEDDAVVELEPVGGSLDADAEMDVLVHEDYHAHNTFENPKVVTPFKQAVNVHQAIIVPRAGIVMIKAKLTKSNDSMYP